MSGHKPHTPAPKTYARCGACRAPDILRYEQQIIDGTITQVEAAQAMCIDQSTLSRHMNRCLPRRLVKEGLKPEQIEIEVPNVLQHAVNAHTETLKLIGEAHLAGDIRAYFLGRQTELKQLQFIANLTGQTDSQPQLNLYLSPEYITLQQVLVASLADYPEARVKLGEALARLRSGATADGGDN